MAGSPMVKKDFLYVPALKIKFHIMSIGFLARVKSFSSSTQER
jgi:hypothetical protein